MDDALRSLHAQSFTDWTATVVDDGSTDATAAIAQRWADRDSRFRLVRSDPVGLAAALQVAVQGTSTLVARFDGDDVCHPERLARQVEFLDRRADIGVVDSRIECFAEGTELGPGMSRYQRWLDTISDDADFERELLVESPVCHPATMIRRSALLPYRQGDFPEDYDLWLRMRRRGTRFHKLSMRLLRWRDRPSRATRTDPRYRRAGFFGLKWEHFAATRPVDDLRIAVWGAHRHGRPWIRELVRHGSPPCAVVDIDPRAVGRTRHGVVIVVPEALRALRPDLVLVAVGAAGARSKIETQLDEMGLNHLAVAGLA